MHTRLMLALASAFALAACCTTRPGAARLELVELAVDTTLPQVPWVTAGDTSFAAHAPLFEFADTAGARATGWVAVTDSIFWLKLNILDSVHTSADTAWALCGGDGIQLGIDALGDGAGNRDSDAVHVGPDDIHVACALTPQGYKTWYYYSGPNLDRGKGDFFGGGPRMDTVSRIWRDEATRVTHYDIRIPWSEMGVRAGSSPVIGIGLLSNNGRDPKRAQGFWGAPARGGMLRPGLYQRVRIAAPSHALAIMHVHNNELWDTTDTAEVRFCTNADKGYTLRATCAGLTQTLKVPGRSAGLRFFAARARFSRLPEQPLTLVLGVQGAGITRMEQSTPVRSLVNSQLLPPAVRCAQVVPALGRIPLERRALLVSNPGRLGKAELDSLIPEVYPVEVRNTYTGKAESDTLRVVAWNMEFGRHAEESVPLLQQHPALAGADILLLSEMDLGVGRSGNRHTTALIADALKMNYAYGVEFMEFRNGIPGIEGTEIENDYGYTGNAVLSRFPLSSARVVRFTPTDSYWYSPFCKRLGGRMAVLASVSVKGHDITLVATHFETHWTEARRCLPVPQMQTLQILRELGSLPRGAPVLLGGDFNAVPSDVLFGDLASAGFATSECNDSLAGTGMEYSKQADSSWAGGERIDYICVKGMPWVKDGTSPSVVSATYPNTAKGKQLSDHAIVSIKVRLPGP